MRVLYNRVSGEILSTDLATVDYIIGRLERNASFLGVKEVDTCDFEPLYKMILHDNFDRDSVPETLVAEKCRLTEEEWEEFDRCVNASESSDYYMLVNPGRKLYDPYEDL